LAVAVFPSCALFGGETLGRCSLARYVVAFGPDLTHAACVRVCARARAPAPRHKTFGMQFLDKFTAGPRVKDEIRVLMSARHENVVSLHAVYETDEDLRLVVDYVEGGELFDRIVSKTRYSEREAAEVIASLLSAVSFLHERSIVHRDIKPENILLASRDSDTIIKLSDFGLAKVFEDPAVKPAFAPEQDGGGGDVMDIVVLSPKAGGRGRERAYTTLGTDWYIAPEILKGQGYGKQVDLWSVGAFFLVAAAPLCTELTGGSIHLYIGVVTYILLCGFPPFADAQGDMNKVYAKIRAGEFSFPSPYWDNVSPIAKNLICRFLTVDPDQRITASGALGHPWIATRATSLGDDTPLSPHHATMFKRFNANRKPFA